MAFIIMKSKLLQRSR